MQAVVIDRPGSYERLRRERRLDPEPGVGEVSVDVAAIGVNYADCLVRMGLYASAKALVGWPITPGFEVAGTVDAVGPGVTRRTRGERVIALTRFGGYATKVVVPEAQVFAAPKHLFVEEAAGFAVVFLTAYYALFELAHVRPGARLLVHSAAGGVGGALVQLGKLAGAEVTGVVGAPSKQATARTHGADHVIDKSTHHWAHAADRIAPRGFDVVLDANGASTLRESYRRVAPGGKLVVYGFHSMLPRGTGRPSWPKLALDWLRTPRFDPLRLTIENRAVLGFNLSTLFDRTDRLAEAMERLLGWLVEGRIQPPPVTAFSLEDVAEAHRALESGATTGKLVLRVEP